MHGFKHWRQVVACLFALCLLSTIAFISSRPSRADVPSYVLIDLNTLGGNESRAFGINDQGRVVGDSLPTGSISRHPFIWYQGQMTDIGTLGGDGQADANSVNEIDYVIGASETTTGAHPYIWSAVFGKRDLGTLNGGSAYAWDVNDASQVVGVSEINPITLSEHAFIWSNSTGMVDLGTFTGGSNSSAQAINNTGQVAGYSNTSTGQTHAFFYSGSGPLIDLGTLGAGSLSIAFGLNDEGKVVGYSTTETGSISPPLRAFLWSSSTGMVNLGTLGGARSIAYDINNRGAVVGFSEIANGERHAFYYDAQNGMLDLNQLIAPGSGWTLTEARGINSTGQIVGIGINPSGQTRGFLLVSAVDEIPGGEPPPCSTQAPLPFVKAPAVTPSKAAAPTPARGVRPRVTKWNPRRVIEP